VPEREDFGGQGAHYLWVLALLSALLFVLILGASALQVGVGNAWRHVFAQPFWWVYALLCLGPLGIGVYYWLLLRHEETVVTDVYIERRSRRGNQRINWADATGFYRQYLPFSQTSLGRIAGLSHVLADNKLINRLPPLSYEITTAGSAESDQASLVIEPGTVSDLPWLLKLISAKLGPPQVI